MHWSSYSGAFFYLLNSVIYTQYQQFKLIYLLDAAWRSNRSILVTKMDSS